MLASLLFRGCELGELLEAQPALAAQVANAGAIRGDLADLTCVGGRLGPDVEDVILGDIPDGIEVRAVRFGHDHARNETECQTGENP
jgi:hypothetical protein